MRQSLTESAAIAVAAGLLGLLVAAVGIRILVAFGPQDVPRLEEIGIDTRVLGFTFGLALLASLLSGSLPTLIEVLAGPDRVSHKT